jgi:autotransporter-associated beta strand protein
MSCKQRTGSKFLINMIKRTFSASLAFGLLATGVTQGNIVISGYLANPQSTDAQYEYVQLRATQAIDFTTTPYSVVFSNNGTATSDGWIAGGALTYGFNLTAGTVSQGDVFYVGGDGKLINGAGSTDISSLNWIRAINTVTTAGDGFGNAATSLGNGGANADGIAVFSGLAGGLTASSVPLDAVFFGSGVGTAKPATGGYTLPTNGFYNNAQGTFGNGTNVALLPDAGTGGTFFRLTGTYSTVSNTWTTNRTAAGVPLTVSSPISAINSAITIDTGMGGPAGVVWTGATNNTWDTTTANWTPGLYTNGVNATFSNNLTANIQLTGALQPNSTIVSATSGTYTFTGDGTTNKLSGTGNLVKSGAGQLVIASDNDFSGGTNLNGGSISISTANPLGVGNINFGGGTLISTAVAPNNLSLPNNLSVLAGGGTVNTGSQNLTVVGADITGILTKSGSGDLIITGPLVGNAGGGLNVQAGNLVLGQTSGTVNLYASGTLTGNLVLNSNIRLNFNGLSNLTGTGQIRVKTSGTLLSTLSGNVGGSVSVPIVLNPDNVTPFLFTIGGTTGGSLTINSVISGTIDSLDFSNNSTGGGGRGTTILNAVHTYTGATLINHNIADNGSVANDSIRLGVNNAIPTTSHVTYGTKSGSGAPMINLNGFNQTVASLSDGSSYSLGTKFLTISNFGGVDSTFGIGNSEVAAPETTSAAVFVDGAKKVTLVKSGTSSQKLTGLSFHTGGTVVNGGTLSAEGSNIVANNVNIVFDTMNPFVIDPVTRSVSNIDALQLVAGQGVDWNNDNTIDAFVQQITNIGSIVLSVNPPLTTTTFSFKSGGSVLGSGPVSVASGATLNLQGAFSAASSVNNITNVGSLNVTGTAQSVGNISGAGSTTVSGAGTSAAPTLIAKDIDQASLTISDGAYVRIAPSGTSTSVVASLTLGSTANLDISDNDVVINNPTPVAAASSLTAVASAVNAGFVSGGNGIVTTTTGTGLETVGFGLNSFLSFPTFNGVSVNDDSVLIKYTYFGDSNLDGFVTDDDLGYFLAGYGSDVSANPWVLGDYNHDGFTTDDDLGFFLAAYGSTPGLAGGGIQAIPEPSTVVLGTLAGLGLGALSLRRRRAK